MKIFILEDDEWYGSMLRYFLSHNPDYDVTLYKTAKELIDNLHLKPDFITVDFSLPDSDGLKVLDKIKSIDPNICVVVVSGQEDVGTAISLLKKGAYDYIIKDSDAKDRLWNVLIRYQEVKSLKNEVEVLRQEVVKKYDFSKVIIGKSEAIQRVFNLIEKASNTSITVSITGETGTGKEMVAKAIHYNSEKHKQPFVAVNVAAIPRELIESELFGHEKGAFTGALTRRIGRFEEANKGTLFLDEIGELDLNLQAKLLRVLQEKEVTRVGGNETVSIDVRIVVATHKNLLDEVKNKTFREDLYYRILGLTIELPPLRERGNDILILSKYFLESFCKENKIPNKTLSSKAQEKLLNYPFPGNVRELKSVIDLSAVMADGSTIEESDISLRPIGTLQNMISKELSLKEYELQIIQFFLDKYNGDVLKVAKVLDIGKSTIYRMIQGNELKTK